MGIHKLTVLSTHFKFEPFAMPFVFVNRQTVESGMKRKISARRNICRVRKYRRPQSPPFFTFQSDTSPSSYFDTSFAPYCSTLSRFVEWGGTLHQRSYQFLVLLFNAAHGHRQHHTERKPNPHLHLLLPTNEMLLKSKTHIQSRIHPLHRRTPLVIPLPRITGSRHRCEDPPVYLQRNPLHLHRIL